MNLFCLGLSHHTADVATREQFAGSATAESILRQSGCAEALLLTTCNRVEVYAVSQKRVSTDEIARCLMRRIDIDPHPKIPVGMGLCHHMGTTRMSDDPAMGVTDGNAKVHRVRNLYIAGSSLFPTCGYANPTLTIVATSIRLADHLKSEMRKDGLL